MGGKLHCGFSFGTLEAVNQEYQRGEVSTSGEVVLDIFVFFLLLLLGQYLLGILSLVGWGVGICDTDVEDHCCPAMPESVDGNVAPGFWHGLHAGGSNTCSAVPT